MSLQLAQKPERCWAPAEICAAPRKPDCKAIQTGGGAFDLATENFNQGVELSVNITAGIFLKATGSQKQSKQHNYIIKSRPFTCHFKTQTLGIQFEFRSLQMWHPQPVL